MILLKFYKMIFTNKPPHVTFGTRPYFTNIYPRIRSNVVLLGKICVHNTTITFGLSWLNPKFVYIYHQLLNKFGYICLIKDWDSWSQIHFFTLAFKLFCKGSNDRILCSFVSLYMKLQHNLWTSSQNRTMNWHGLHHVSRNVR